MFRAVKEIRCTGWQRNELQEMWSVLHRTVDCHGDAEHAGRQTRRPALRQPERQE
jgi:hypothetical protein